MGWVLRVDVLFTLGTATAMQLNTALGLLLCAAILALPTRWRRTAIWSGAVAGGLGVATIAEHVTGVSLGIDTALLTPHTVPAGGVAGRMAWQTAVCLAMAGAAAAAIRMRLPRAPRSAAAGIAGAIVVATTLFVIAGGAIVNGGLMDWTAWTSVAVGTALALLCVGAVLLLIGWRLHQPDRHVRWAPVAALLGVATVGGLLWHWLGAAEARAAHEALGSVARDVVKSIVTEIGSVRGAQERMAARSRAAGETPDDVWDADAGSYVRDLRLMYLWRFREGRPARVVARDGAQAPPGLSERVQRLCVTAPPGWSGHTVIDGEIAFATGLVRLRHPSGTDECLVVATPWTEVMSRALPPAVPVAARVSVDGRPLFAAGGPPAVAAPWLTIPLGRGGIDLSIAPTPDFVTRHRTWTAELTLLAFLVFGGFAAVALRQMQAAGDQQAALLAASEATSTARLQAAIALENAGGSGTGISRPVP